VFVGGPLNQEEPQFSPDGKWVAYQSNESGRNEVYVRPFPGPGARVQVSTDSGFYPMWSRSRPDLLFGVFSQQIMVASYTVEGDSFRPAKPKLWSPGRYITRPRLRSFDLHPDGNRLAVAAVQETQTAEKQDEVVFIFNFFDELRRIAPAKP
jgi:hypothetical protein